MDYIVKSGISACYLAFLNVALLDIRTYELIENLNPYDLKSHHHEQGIVRFNRDKENNQYSCGSITLFW